MFEGMVDRALSRTQAPVSSPAEGPMASAATAGAEGGTGSFAAVIRTVTKSNLL
jgi:hypothetical protein